MDYEEIGYRAAQPGQGRHPRQRRAGRRPVDHRPPRPRPDDRARPLAERLKQLIPRQMFEIPIQAAIGIQRHRPRNRPRHAQERAGQVLRWRHHPQAQAAREAEGGQAADEAGRLRRDPAGGVPGDAPVWTRARSDAWSELDRPLARPDRRRADAAAGDAPPGCRALRDRRVLREPTRTASAARPSPAGLVRDGRRGRHRAAVHPSRRRRPTCTSARATGSGPSSWRPRLRRRSGIAQAVGLRAWYRYHRIRFPDTCVLPRCAAQLHGHRVHRRGHVPRRDPRH